MTTSRASSSKVFPLKRSSSSCQWINSNWPPIKTSWIKLSPARVAEWHNDVMLSIDQNIFWISFQTSLSFYHWCYAVHRTLPVRQTKLAKDSQCCQNWAPVFSLGHTSNKWVDPISEFLRVLLRGSSVFFPYIDR